MSNETVQKVVEKAATDAAFRQKLVASATQDQALEPYKKDLTEDEIVGLKALTEVTLEGIEASIRSAKRTHWYEPSAFRELGAAILSLFVLIIMLIVVAVAVVELGSDPRTIVTGGTTDAQGVVTGGTSTVVDEWDRAQDLITILFPLFTAVLSFWLGVAVEGRRADENKKTAEEATETKKTTETKLGQTEDKLEKERTKVEKTLGRLDPTEVRSLIAENPDLF